MAIHVSRRHWFKTILGAAASLVGLARANQAQASVPKSKLYGPWLQRPFTCGTVTTSVYDVRNRVVKIQDAKGTTPYKPWQPSMMDAKARTTTYTYLVS